MNPQKKLFIIGTGPGSPEHLTISATEAIRYSDVIVGYKPYIEQLGPLVDGKRLVSSGMTREIERCRAAVELARSGENTALVSGGDAGIYGMAGLVLELLHSEGDTGLDVTVIPGISAFQAAASRLGAPIMHDSAIISLSDLLTPWELIARRIEAAASADFVISLYNPKSRQRTGQLAEACRIIASHRPLSTPVGIVKNACRAEERITVSTLSDLHDADVDMSTVVIIGNSSTFVDARGRMVTPRGYAGKGEFGSQGPGAGDQGPERHKTPGALMVVGTASDVGKSAVTAGICRLLLRRGLKVGPFKSQNMALNAAVTPEGGEIGRAQAAQAAACRITPHTDMNPVLLKPATDVGSQVIVQGRSVGNMTVAEYDRFKPTAFESIRESFARLRNRFDFIVMEGAGSIAEINLKDRDIANLAVARMAGDAPAILVADIDRGGVFAQVIGSIELLEDWERRLVKGIIINKFRGDISILRPGLDYIEKRCNIPVLGVLPYMKGLALPSEDSMNLPAPDSGERPADRLCIGVIRLPRISNFTDFEPLQREPDVTLIYIERPEQTRGLDLLIIPGTKSTAADLAWLRSQGLDRAIASRTGALLGICGGFQMLGERIEDPEHVESAVETVEGLALLPAVTRLMPGKTTRQVMASPAAGGLLVAPQWSGEIRGYEIHAGVTELEGGSLPFATLVSEDSGKSWNDGAVSGSGMVAGTYLHGLFDDSSFRNSILNRLRVKKGLSEREGAEIYPDPYDSLADSIGKHLDMELLWKICGIS